MSATAHKLKRTALQTRTEMTGRLMSEKLDKNLGLAFLQKIT